MTILGKRSWWLAIAIGVTVGSTGGCQTYVPDTGQTLPSGYYLHHLPQYFPPSPQFPLPKEEAGLEQATSQQASTQPQGR